MAYVDGFVFPVQKKHFAAYKKMAQLGGRVWKKHGALQYMECRGDDLNPKMAAFTFLKLVKPKKGEEVWLSFITYKSRKHRDQVNAKVMQDPMMNDPKSMGKVMPFDMKRMAVGGFEVIVDA